MIRFDVVQTVKSLTECVCLSFEEYRYDCRISSVELSQISSVRSAKRMQALSCGTDSIAKHDSFV